MEPSGNENAPVRPKESNRRGGKRRGAGRKPGNSSSVVVLAHFARAFRDAGLPVELPGMGLAENPRKRRRQLDYAEDQLPGPARQERKPARDELRRLWSKARTDGLTGALSREALLERLIALSERAATQCTDVDPRIWQNWPRGALARDHLTTGIAELHDELAQARASVLNLVADAWQQHVENDRGGGEWLRQVKRVPTAPWGGYGHQPGRTKWWPWPRHRAWEIDATTSSLPRAYRRPQRLLVERWLFNVEGGSASTRSLLKDPPLVGRVGLVPEWHRANPQSGPYARLMEANGAHAPQPKLAPWPPRYTDGREHPLTTRWLDELTTADRQRLGLDARPGWAAAAVRETFGNSQPLWQSRFVFELDTRHRPPPRNRPWEEKYVCDVKPHDLERFRAERAALLEDEARRSWQTLEDLATRLPTAITPARTRKLAVERIAA